MQTTLTMGGSAGEDRFSRYFSYAIAAHVLFFAAIAFVPSEWLARESDNERNIMYISLGGSVGDDASGLRTVAARAVQEATPEPQRPQFQAPAEQKTPVMAIPEKPVTKPKPAPTPITKTPIQTTQTPISRTPIRGEQTRQGTARVDTKVETGSDGLALASGGGTGGETNLSNFCCPGYITAMSAAIKRNWKQNQGVPGMNVVRFTIERDGRVTNIEMVEESLHFPLNRESRVVLMNAKLPPLPAQFTEPKLVIRLIFEYR